MPSILIEGVHDAEFLVTEAPGTLSREVVTILAGNNIVAGTVLAKVTTSSKYVPLNPAGEDGSQTAVAIAFANVNATDGDRPCVVIKRIAEVKGQTLAWIEGVTEQQKAAALTALEAAHIVAR